MTGRRSHSTAPSIPPVGYAVIGIGHISQEAVLPAFAHVKNSRLVALVSSDQHKREALGRKYKVDTYTYEDLEECLAREDVQAAYIALPNSMHVEYAERCARAGVHVLCEKPMALSDSECERMISACRESDVRLMIAYRLHFEAANLHCVELCQRGKLGELRFFSSVFSYQVRPENIRTQAEKGGGPLWDLGVYPINEARMLFRAEPTEVFAFQAERKDDPRFKEVYESISVLMRFPQDRLAQFTVSFGGAVSDEFTLIGTRGQVRLESAYDYTETKLLTVEIDEKTKKRAFPRRDQFGAELQYFSDCVREGRDPEPSGKEGRADVRIVEAIHQSLASGHLEPVEDVGRRRRPEPEQELDLPPVRATRLVDVSPPHQ